MKFLKKNNNIYKTKDTKPPSLYQLNSNSTVKVTKKSVVTTKHETYQINKKPEISNKKAGSEKNSELQTQQKKSSDIDDIFGLVKPKKKAQVLEIEQPKKRFYDEDSSFGLIKSSTSQIISPEAPLERIDKASGLPVYKAHLLKVGEGGGTPLCPFDCDCCF
jgi:hypothetical protein